MDRLFPAGFALNVLSLAMPTPTPSGFKSPLRCIILIGLPGAGKGTIGRTLGALPGFHFFSTGETFRALRSETELGRKVQQLMRRGEMVPDELTVTVWHEQMQERAARDQFSPQDDVLVLDGLPRTTQQAELMDPHLDVLKVLWLEGTSDKQLIHRLHLRAVQEARPDDADEEIIRKRMEMHREMLERLIEHYPKRKVATIDASKPVLQVVRQVTTVLGRIKDLQ